MTNPQTWFCRNRYKNSHLNRQIYRCELFIYLCSCLSIQFLYRTAVKATFNVKENIKDNIKNSIALIINITTSPTIFRKIQVAKPHLFLIISYVTYSTILFLFCL